jgi:transcriptional regulator with XRE-family HTH domain
MGRAARLRSKRLPGKLRRVREALGLSQNELIRLLGLAGKIYQSNVSGYESGEREPPLPVLVKYAKVARVHVEDLIDDDLDLPAKLPGRVRRIGSKD